MESFAEAGSAQDVCRTGTSAPDLCYAKPQICPSLAPIGFCSRKVGAEPAAFNLLLTNPSTRPLTITGYTIRGDTRCAFEAPQLSPALGQPIAPGDGMIFRFKYRPPARGEDHVQIDFTSDAENFPLLPVRACGRGVTSTTAPGALMCIDCQDRAEAEVTPCD